MLDCSPAFEGIEREFGDLLDRLDESEATGPILIVATAAVAGAIVASLASLVLAQAMF